MNYRYLLLLTFIGIFGFACAKNVEYADIYCNQAESSLVSLVDEVVQEIGYQGNYELVEPNKIGLQLNPWNGMLSYAVNPTTKNNLIVINPSWFNNLAQAEQKFLIARCLVKFEQGLLPTSINLITYFFIALMSVLFPLVFWLFNKTGLKKRSVWLRICLVYAVGVSLNYTVLRKLQLAVVQYACFKYEAKISRLALVKLPNKSAAISALDKLDLAIKDGIKTGHDCFKSSENMFADLAKDLRV